MKFIAVLALFVAVAVAAPAKEKPEVTVVMQNSEIDEHGNFHNAVELSDGSKSMAEGVLKANVDPKEPSFIASHGSYEYTAPDGQLVHVVWTADETGFHPTGKHLPVGPVV